MGNTDEDIRNQQRVQWTAASEGWINRREEVSSPTRPITELIVKLSKVSPGAHVLDLACGVGDPAFTIADIVGPHGYVLGLDIAEAMVEGSLSWAKEHDVSNANFRTIKNELELGVSNESFDLSTCRHGLMFMPNPQLALQVMASATKKEGRITISTWGLPQNSPAFTLPGQVIGRYVKLPTPDPKAPGLFALSTSEIHTRLFEGIGFQDIEVHKFDCPVMIAESPEEMWELITTMGGPMVKVIKDLQSSIRELIRKDILETLFNMFQSGRVILTAEAIVTTGTKPI
jgi:SAM-dependent methyltransferase